MTDTLTGLSVAILVTDGFEQVEMTGPLHALEQADATVKIIGEHAGQVQGKNHAQPGDRFDVHLSLADADPMEFDAVMLPGGKQNGEYICTLPQAQRFVQEMDEMGKPIAAICHGAQILAAARVLEGRICSAYPACRAEVELAGGKYAEIEVNAAVTDGNLVSAPAWPAHPEWIAQFLKVLGTEISV